MTARRRGFTLLELVIGTTMSLAIAGVAMGTLVSVQQTQKESMLKNAATRDAMYMLDMVGGDLGYAGVGVPWSFEVDFPSRNRRLRPVVRIASEQMLAFIGDLPLPNSDFNGIAQLAAIGPGGTSIAVTSELSLCPPSAGPTFHCDTRINGLVGLPSGGSDCSSDATSTTCPWSQGKWSRTSGSAFAGQLLLLSTPTGQWAWRRVAFDGAGVPTVVTIGNVRGVALVDDFPGGISGDGALRADAFTGTGVHIGASTISTLDRVFYSAEKLSGGRCTSTDRKCVLVRRHCWGEVLDPTSPGFPAAGTAPFTAALTPAGCEVPDMGTAWEPVANNLESFKFRYFDINDVELTSPVATADLPRIASIAVEIVIARETTGDAGGLVVRHRVDRRYFLESGDAFGEMGRR